MALYTTPESKAEGQANFKAAVGQQNRREFFKTVLASTGAVGAGLGAAWYFGYQKPKMGPLKVGLIGAGDEGGVLIGEHNPDYTEVVAVCDIRPYNMWPTLEKAKANKEGDRIFRGESRGPRKGLIKKYGRLGAEKIERYVKYEDLFKHEGLDAVIIALPLHLHAPVAIAAMEAGLHVFCEKLMARTVRECKDMVQAAKKNKRVLAIGHQRHYSLLYHHAMDVVNAGHLGDIRHIRAQWHRNNHWPRLNSKGEIIKETVNIGGKNFEVVERLDSWHKDVVDIDREALKDVVSSEYNYRDMEELIRWRLSDRTGGGLMAELGSHQLDAGGLFLKNLYAKDKEDGTGKEQYLPIAVSGTGYLSFYDDEREVDDHVFTTFEFPGKHYEEKGKFNNPRHQDVVVMTYSSINTNEFEPYGECLMGTEGTLVVEKEQLAALFPERKKNIKGSKPAISATVAAGGAKPVVDTSSSTGYAEPEAQKLGEAILGSSVSRGYQEELEDFAYVCKLHDDAGKDSEAAAICRGEQPAKDPSAEVHPPRCHGVVALADAVMALTANEAMRTGQRIPFDKEWFNADNLEAVPDEFVQKQLKKNS